MASEPRDAWVQTDATTEEHLKTHRRELHASPEVSFQEIETARYIAERLDALAPDRLETGVAGNGVVADFRGQRRHPSVLVRADMDGLPIEEAADLPFRSSRRGVMHACGHDAHMAIALEVARTIADHRRDLPGLVRFAFQPAEERGAGAKPMIEARVLDAIDRVVGLHVWSELPVGQVSVRAGAVMAGSDMFTLTIRGKGGHGAQPEAAVDAVVIASQVVGVLQTLVSRETGAASPVVVTLGSVHGVRRPTSSRTRWLFKARCERWMLTFVTDSCSELLSSLEASPPRCVAAASFNSTPRRRRWSTIRRWPRSLPRRPGRSSVATRLRPSSR